ncbi:MAG: type II toxin-antitoxin system RelE/ParE family toxin [bacterium]
MKNIKLHTGAQEDLKSGIEWYDAQLDGLGKIFKKVIKDTILKIQKKPSWYLNEEEPIKKAYVPRFPYKILFTEESEVVIIWAIAHLHRKPKFWKERIG